jgi:glyoxylase-like metal-dependent hydrolase (beta-lactamase superfamily II)
MASPLTCELARAHGMPVPDPIAGFETGPYRLSGDCELLFLGPGHTRDNIVAWLPLRRVLFGGCLLKSSTSEGLGNIADSDIAAWPASVRHVRDRYPDATIVVPGHGTIAGDPIGTTLSLLAKRKGGAPAP